MPKASDTPRFWVIDSHEYTITLDDMETEYVGLVDEEEGGIVAFGSIRNVTNLARLLNDLVVVIGEP